MHWLDALHTLNRSFAQLHVCRASDQFIHAPKGAVFCVFTNYFDIEPKSLTCTPEIVDLQARAARRRPNTKMLANFSLWQKMLNNFGLQHKNVREILFPNIKMLENFGFQKKKLENFGFQHKNVREFRRPHEDASETNPTRRIGSACASNPTRRSGFIICPVDVFKLLLNNRK